MARAIAGFELVKALMIPLGPLSPSPARSALKVVAAALRASQINPIRPDNRIHSCAPFGLCRHHWIICGPRPDCARTPIIFCALLRNCCWRRRLYPIPWNRSAMATATTARATNGIFGFSIPT